MAKKLNKRVYALPSNMSIVLAAPELLSDCECFICNDIEAGHLFKAETAGKSKEEMLNILKQGMSSMKVPSMVVTMGERGAVYGDTRYNLWGHIPAADVKVVDTSGAGDGFFSGTVAGLIKGYSLDKAVVIGTRLAGLTIQSISCNCEREVIQREKLL